MSRNQSPILRLNCRHAVIRNKRARFASVFLVAGPERGCRLQSGWVCPKSREPVVLPLKPNALEAKMTRQWKHRTSIWSDDGSPEKPTPFGTLENKSPDSGRNRASHRWWRFWGPKNQVHRGSANEAHERCDAGGHVQFGGRLRSGQTCD